MFDYTKYQKTWEPTEYSLNLQKEEKEKREKEEIENEKLLELRLQKEEKDTKEFIKFFVNHPLTSEMINTLKQIEPSKRTKSNPVYILDNHLNIIEVLQSKNLIGRWTRNNGYSKKILGRTTIFEYIRNRMMYDNKFYFVPALDYEKFMKEVFVI